MQEESKRSTLEIQENVALGQTELQWNAFFCSFPWNANSV